MPRRNATSFSPCTHTTTVRNALRTHPLTTTRGLVTPPRDMSAQVLTLDSDSPPRVMFSGEQLLIEHLPPGTRVLYPKPPIVGLRDPDAAIRYALNHPLGMEP